MQNGKHIPRPLLFLIGIDEFLEFGLERIRDQLFWFMLPYNIKCEKRIMPLVGIKNEKLNERIASICKRVDAGETIVLYFDNRMRSSDTRNIYKQTHLTQDYMTGDMMFNSFGLIHSYDSIGFTLGISDLGGLPIHIEYSFLTQDIVSDAFAKLSFDSNNFPGSEKELTDLIVNNLVLSCDKYTKVKRSYEYNEINNKYGTSGNNCFPALLSEIQALADTYEQVGDKNIADLLVNRLNVLRIYQSKGTKTCYRQEMSDALRILAKSCNCDSLYEVADAFSEVAKLWRNFGRILFQVNSPFYRSNPTGYVKKITPHIEKLYNAETTAVTRLRNTLRNLQ
jgi:hypothetical protein